MGFLRINQVRYEGENYYFTSPRLDQKISIIEGDNGTGKTTFFDFVYFALGGTVKKFKEGEKDWHVQIVEDKNNYVEIDITIDSSSSFLIQRYIRNSFVTIVPYSEAEENQKFYSYGGSEVLPITRSKQDDFIYSDWLLGKLGIHIVELYLGYNKFKINVTDLFRLVYHNQALDPNRIYKEPDVGGFVADSELVRKAIFELWMGKSFSAYYEAVNDLKVAEKEKNEANSFLQEYIRSLSHISGAEEVKNLTALKAEKEEKETQLEKLFSSREKFKSNRGNPGFLISEIAEAHHDFAETEIRLSELKSELYVVYKEKSSLVNLQENIKDEVKRISKILHTHNQLNLFSADTCPFCLGKVDRVKDKCICGTDIDESQYERFFYTGEEYSKLLKAKAKTLETVSFAIDEVREKEEKIKLDIKDGEMKLSEYRQFMQSQAQRPIDMDLAGLDTIDDKILDVKLNISEIDKRIQEEQKLDSLQKRFDNKRDEYEEKKTAMKIREAEAEASISHIVKKFSEKYNSFMTDALSECRNARIAKEDYMPVINNGEYREASSAVPKRLMYFLTMLKMALDEKSVRFPNLLLIDTPETGGIESEHLIQAIGQIDSLDKSKDYQIILSTGISKYPRHMEHNRVMFLEKKNKLLQSK